jgi:hypothetical protein
MSEAGNAVRNRAAATANVPNNAGPNNAGPNNAGNAPNSAGNRVAELKVSGHLMTLDTGMFCIFHAPGVTVVDDGSGLPGVRISLPPAAAGQPDTVNISTFRSDGWLDFADGAALVRVDQGPAQILVTVYQSPAANADTAPRLQVLRLSPDAAAAAPAGAVRGPAAQADPGGAPLPASANIVAHVQRMGDVTGEFGAWTGTRGSGSWVEGFAVIPPEGVTPQDLEYQAVLGRGWLSPWIEGGKFCGSRGMALPLLGLNVRLKGDAAKSHECSYFATFVDGSSVGPVPAGEACQADSLAALEAFQITLRRRGGAPALRPAVGRPGVAVAAPKPAIERPKVAAPAAKPAVERPRAAAPAPAGKPVAPTQKRGAPHVAPRSAPRR